MAAGIWAAASERKIEERKEIMTIVHSFVGFSAFVRDYSS
jgi:hypothetical protein